MAMREAMSKAQSEIRKLTKEEWEQILSQDIDPLWHAGEGISDTEEIPRAQDIKNPYLRARIGKEGDYYPGIRKQRR